MRLKATDGALSVYNGNNADILNSPKRLNTTQNSNVISNYTNSNFAVTLTQNSNDVITELTTSNEEATLNNINAEDTVQWCNPALAQKRQLSNNVNNRNQLFNINSTLAVSLEGTRHGTASSVYSESSPDDSLVDFEGAYPKLSGHFWLVFTCLDVHQSCSSVESTPQDEDRGFDLSDSDSLSEEGNSSNGITIQRRGIVNPNYPGFQHLAHTLEYSIKASSDTDFTDDDFDCESFNVKLDVEGNNINNNNNEETEYQIDHIDSVNRLDSVENIQKVFYDKPVLIASESLIRNNCDSEEGGSSTSNQGSDDDYETQLPPNISLNIPPDSNEKTTVHESISCGNIIGDFGKEVEQEFGRISLETKDFFSLDKAVEQELEEAFEKLTVSNDLTPTATKYNIEPNTEEPFNKSTAQIADVPEILEDSAVVQQETMATISIAHLNRNDLLGLKMKSEPAPEETVFKIKLKDAFLSGIHDNVLDLEKKFLDSNSNCESMDVEEAPATNNQRRDSNRLAEKQKPANETKPEEIEKFCKEDKTKDDKEKDDDSAVPRKKEKMEINYVKKRRDYNQQIGSLITFPRRELNGRNRDALNRRSLPVSRDKKKTSPEILGKKFIFISFSFFFKFLPLWFLLKSKLFIN